MPDSPAYPDASAVEATIDAAPLDAADIDNLTGDTDQGTPPANLRDLDPDAIPDDIPYRDAKALRDQVTKAKQQWAPYEQAFGDMDEARRTALLERVPDLAPFTDLHPDDLQVLNYFAQIVQTGDSKQIAAFLDEIGAPFRETGETADTADTDTADSADTDAPLTRSEMDRILSERDQQAEERRILGEMHHEMRELGYDPDSRDANERARVGHLLWLASEHDGDIAKAHETIAAEQQRIIDEYVASKRTDASRTAAAPVGGSPSTERQITTISEAGEAAETMIDAYFNR